jgi:glutamate formiminotransferase / formiminotetrahydrofolate cyclodeaminase
VVGARKFLIAYNVNLGTPDISIAKDRQDHPLLERRLPLREIDGRDAGHRNQAQVSINLTDFEQTPMHLVFETVRREAERYGVPVVGSEIVGLIPKKAIEMSAEYFLRYENFRPELVLENRIAEAVGGAQRTAGIPGRAGGPTATPGGGSASGGGGGDGAALGAMVTRLAKQDPEPFEETGATSRKRWIATPRRSSSVMAAYKRPKTSARRSWKKRCTAPRWCRSKCWSAPHAMSARLEKLEMPARYGSDLAVAKALTAAARRRRAGERAHQPRKHPGRGVPGCGGSAAGGRRPQTRGSAPRLIWG